MIYDILSIILLGIIVFQDFKYKAISWIILPLLFVFTLISAFQKNAVIYVGEQFILNMAFILFQLAMVTVYFSVKNRKMINIWNTYLGLGDLLFFIILAGSFSFINFVLVYLSSLFIIIVAYALYRIIKKDGSEQIPLAGGMAAVMIFCLLFKNSKNLNFYDNTFVLALSGQFVL